MTFRTCFSALDAVIRMSYYSKSQIFCLLILRTYLIDDGNSSVGLFSFSPSAAVTERMFCCERNDNVTMKIKIMCCERINNVTLMQKSYAVKYVTMMIKIMCRERINTMLP